MDTKKAVEDVRLMAERVLKAGGHTYAWVDEVGVNAWGIEESAGKSDQHFCLTLSPYDDHILINGFYVCPKSHATRSTCLELANAMNDEGEAGAVINEDDILMLGRIFDLQLELGEDKNEALLASCVKSTCTLLRRFADVASAVFAGETWEMAKTRLLDAWEVAEKRPEEKKTVPAEEPPREPPTEEEDYQAALAEIRKTRRASVSHLQRRLGWGYNRAAKIINLLEARGVIGPVVYGGQREILDAR